MNAKAIEIEVDHVFVQFDDAPVVVHYMLGKRTKLMLAGLFEPRGNSTYSNRLKVRPITIEDPCTPTGPSSWCRGDWIC
jgi:hypothetical protein